MKAVLTFIIGVPITLFIAYSVMIAVPPLLAFVAWITIVDLGFVLLAVIALLVSKGKQI